MTIDDELLIELLKPDRFGEVGDGALIIKIVGSKNIYYQLEEPTYFWRIYTKHMPNFYTEHIPKFEREVVKIRPDIMVIFPSEKFRHVAIEVENDVQWDFGKSLEQVKKYKEQLFEDTRVIIPKEYMRFAPLYKHEGFRVYLWKAKRKWKCLRCGTITPNESRVPPKCRNKECDNKSRNEFDLVGLKDTEIEEFI